MWSSTNNDKQCVKNGQTYGMTSAISTAPPKLIDIQRTKELEEALKPHDVTESDEELNHRYFLICLIKMLFTNNLLFQLCFTSQLFGLQDGSFKPAE